MRKVSRENPEGTLDGQRKAVGPRYPCEAAAFVALLLRPTSAQWPGKATTQPQELLAPNPDTCLCSDADPRDGVYYNVTFTCLQQLVYGSCDQPFMKNAVKELSEGFCQVTCGRCTCCKMVADVLTTNNANSLIQVAQLAGLSAQLASPASMFTLLAPTDAAFSAALPSLGASTLQAVPVSTLEAVLDYHIIPPHAYIDAVWTSPFFKVATAGIPTVLPNANLTFNSTGTGLTVTGASNSANIVTSDVEACKSFINIIDAVLIPPKGAVSAPLPVSAGNIATMFGPAPVPAELAAAVQGATPPGTTAAAG